MHSPVVSVGNRLSARARVVGTCLALACLTVAAWPAPLAGPRHADRTPTTGADPGSGAQATSPAPALSRLFRLDPEASQVRFSLGATLHTVHGSALLLRGEIRVSNDGAVSGEILVQARSLDTANKRRDRKMHTRVLESEHYPEIALEVTGLSGVVPREGEAAIVVQGNFLLHGGKHPIRIPLQVSIEDGRFAATGEFTVPYVAWGLRDPSSFVLRVAKEVQIHLDISGLIEETDRAADLPP